MSGIREALEGMNFYATQGAEDVVLVNNTTKTHLVTVPEGETWEIFGGRLHNADDVNRNCSVQAFDEDGNDIVALDIYVLRAALSVHCFPRNDQNVGERKQNMPLILTGGDYVRFYWGAGGVSSGGTAKIHLQRKVYKQYS